MEICRNAGGDAPASASEAEARRIESERMATVSLRNVKKIYPFVSGENKKKKKLQEMRDNLSVGDTITTIGGIVGKIVNISNDYLTIETSEDRVRVQFAKWAVSTVGKAPEEPQK